MTTLRGENTSTYLVSAPITYSTPVTATAGSTTYRRVDVETLKRGDAVVRAWVDVTTPFNGTTALQVAMPGRVSRLVRSTDMAAQLATGYGKTYRVDDVSQAEEYDDDIVSVLLIQEGAAATQGAARFYAEVASRPSPMSSRQP